MFSKLANFCIYAGCLFQVFGFNINLKWRETAHSRIKGQSYVILQFSAKQFKTKNIVEANKPSGFKMHFQIHKFISTHKITIIHMRVKFYSLFKYYVT